MSVEEQLDRLEEDLDPWLPRTGDMEELLSPVAKASDTFETELQNSQDGLTIDTVSSKEELDKIANPLGLTSPESESLESYKKRVRLHFRQTTGSGRPYEILEFLSSLVEIDEERVILENNRTGPTSVARVPLQAVQNNVGSVSKAVELANSVTAATYKLEVIGTGTLEYITPTEQSTGSYDSSKGYAGLDSNGNITDGGTYSGNYS